MITPFPAGRAGSRCACNPPMQASTLEIVSGAGFGLSEGTRPDLTAAELVPTQTTTSGSAGQLLPRPGGRGACGSR